MSETQTLHFASLKPPTRRLVGRLGTVLDDDFYLAGSAALALYLDHRPVSGLDFMSAVHRLLPPQRRDLLQLFLELDPEVRVETARDGYLFLRFAEAVPVRFYYYPYPLAAPLEVASAEVADEAVQVASPLDLGLMKLGAIISRGSRRDFVDLYLLRQVTSITRLLEAAEDKFGHVLDFPLQAMKALADRSQWSDQPLPELRQPLDESDLIAWLDREIDTFSTREIGI